jgi:putative transposase
VPHDADGLRRGLAPRVDQSGIAPMGRRTGHFWQGRFGAVVMDEEHLAAAVRYVALNPVRARLVDRPQHWRWSSVRAHLTGQADGLTRLAPITDRFPRFADLLALDPDEAAFERLRRAESIGRPLGDGSFFAEIEERTKRILRPGKRGPKPKPGED